MSPPNPQVAVDVEALVHRAGCPVVGSVDASDWCLPVQPFIAFAHLCGDWSEDEILAAMDAYAVAHGGQRVPVRTTREVMVDTMRRFRRQPRPPRHEVWMVPMPARDVEP
jgi:hypothetical protein